MQYTILSTNQQAQILRSFMESAEADHYRATIQRNAAAALPEGTGNVDGLDQQLAAAEAQWNVAKAALDELAKVAPVDVLPGVVEPPAAAPTTPAPEAAPAAVPQETPPPS